MADANSKRKKLQLIAAGRDVADLIVGSHRALEIFKAFYSEWDECRGKSVSLLEQLEVVVDKSSRESDKIGDVIQGINRLGDDIPHPGATFGARIAAAIGTFFAGLFAKQMSEKELKAKEFEIRQTFQKDIDSTSLVYVHGVQCSSQFEETRKYIKTFHRLVTQEEELESIIDDEDVLEFLNEIAFYNPENISVFYRRLKSLYVKLLKSSQSAETRHFIRVFEEVPASVQIIDLLAWRFDTDGDDVKTIDTAWKELFDLFVNPQNFDVKRFLDKIRNCIFFLNKERNTLKRTKKNLLGDNMQQLS